MMDDADLYDYLREHFGVGDWDESEPWYKARAREVAKVKSSRTKRQVSVEALHLAARYCFAEHIAIRNVVDLYRYIPASVRWERDREAALKWARDRRELEDAISVEMQAVGPGSEWLDRLLRAHGQENVEEVLAEWRKTRAWTPRSLP